MTSPLARLDTIETAIAAIKDGRPVVVIDDEDRENEGDLIFASELATPDLVAFMVRYTSGYICVAVTEADADRLDLPRTVVIVNKVDDTNREPSVWEFVALGLGAWRTRTREI